MDNFTLRLLTINTWKCDGQYRQRLDLLKQGLRALQPTVVACQEAFQSTEGQADTARELAQALGMKYSSVPARLKPRLFEGAVVKSYSGLALLSAYPIRQTWTSFLPTDPRDGERMAQYCLIDTPATPTLVINTHLTHLPNSSALRKLQLDTLLQHPSLANHDGPVFLCGDLNAEAHSEEIQLLHTYRPFFVRDAYVAGKGQLPGYTMRSQQELTRGKRIDFIFSIASLEERLPIITDARVVLDQPGETGIYPSDHSGVMIQTDLFQK